MPPLQTVYPRIDDAQEVVASELEINAAKSDAFEAFRSRLRQLEPATTVGVGFGGSLAAASSAAGIEPDAVRAAYRQTVMAMAHYDREYGESLLENVGAEFGGTVRGLLADDTPITAIQRGVIDTAVDRSFGERRQFQRALDAERTSLATVRERLGASERRFQDVREGTGAREALRDLAAECQQLSRERQLAVHHGPAPKIAGVGEKTLTTFLYKDREYQFPALVEITDVAERIETTLAALP